MKEQPTASRTKSLGIHFGFLADHLAIQIKKQGFKFDYKTVNGFNTLVENVLTINLAGLINDSTKSKALERLHKKIVAHVKKFNKLK